MHITLVTIGSRGDVQPFVALGVGLKQAGFNVRVATHAPFRSFVEQYGLTFAPIHSDPQEMLRSEAGRAWLDSDRNPLALITNMVRLGRPLFRQLIDDVTAACADTDAIVYSIFGTVAYHLAESRGLPSVMVHLQPVMGRHAQFPAPGSPTWPTRIPGLASLYNRFTYRLVEQVFWQPFRALVQDWRENTLGLDRISFWGPYEQLRQKEYPYLYAYSSHVVPRPSVWPDHYTVTGYWQRPQPSWKPPPQLQDFLAAGDAPVYLGFGSMTDENPTVLREMIVAALQKVGRRGVLLRGWAGLAAADLPDSILVVDQVPHEWLFPRMAAVVHHGGAGTTAAGLTAGIPSVVVPYFADQHFWGERVAALGAGPASLPRRDLTAERLAQRLDTAVNDADIRARAAEMGQMLGREDGVGRAVHFLRDYFGA